MSWRLDRSDQQQPENDGDAAAANLAAMRRFSGQAAGRPAKASCRSRLATSRLGVNRPANDSSREPAGFGGLLGHRETPRKVLLDGVLSRECGYG